MQKIWEKERMASKRAMHTHTQHTDIEVPRRSNKIFVYTEWFKRMKCAFILCGKTKRNGDLVMANAFYMYSISFILPAISLFFLFILLYMWVVKVSLSRSLVHAVTLLLYFSRSLALFFVFFYGVSFMIRSISLQWMFGPFMLPCNIYYSRWLVVCTFAVLAGWLWWCGCCFGCFFVGVFSLTRFL